MKEPVKEATTKEFTDMATLKKEKLELENQIKELKTQLDTSNNEKNELKKKKT